MGSLDIQKFRNVVILLFIHFEFLILLVIQKSLFILLQVLFEHNGKQETNTVIHNYDCDNWIQIF